MLVDKHQVYIFCISACIVPKFKQSFIKHKASSIGISVHD